MKVLIFSDVHGNLPAFESMLKHVGYCDAYICLGDLVNYGPWSNECVDLALSLNNSIIIKGNHEDAFIQGFYPGDNKLVQTFFDHCIQGFSKNEHIASFINDYKNFNFTFCHTLNNRYIYSDTEVEFEGNYVIGHSHQQFKKESNGFLLYNAGSVGQNRKFINLSSFITYNTDKKSMEMHNIKYDFNCFINELYSRSYPASCINYYLSKEQA